ncbi:MAG: TolC family protein [Geobacteraceae bacterium]|nr:TolC family protein [Geobacteraceae bacterium]
MRFKTTLVFLLFFFVIAGSAWSRETTMEDAMQVTPTVNADSGISRANETEIAFVEELSVGGALARTLKYSPSLAAYDWRIRAREAAALQAGLFPNPELSMEVENVFGSGELSGTDAAETTALLSQMIELGGKRVKRREVAALGAELAEWDYQSQRLEVLTKTGKSFIAVLAAQLRLEQAAELSTLAKNFFTTVSERVEAGKVSPVDLSRAQVTLAAARIALAQAETRLAAARRSLAAVWGISEPAFGKAAGSLGELHPLPREEELKERLAKNPDLARWETEIAQRKAAVELSRARRIPDLTFSLGVKNTRETDDTAAIVGIGLPLPLFDRNQGGIKEASSELAGALHHRQSIRAEALAALADSYRDLSSAYVEAQSLKENVLPAAHKAFEAVQIGYEAGKFGFLEVLDAQRTLFEVTQQYTDALADYHQARIEVKRLIGDPLANNIDTHAQENN